MAKLSTNTLGRKSIALLVLVAFVITSIVWNPAQGFGETVGPDLADIFRAAPQQPDRLSGLPPEIGTIQRLDGGWRMEDGAVQKNKGLTPSALRHPSSGFVVLIQDAHANPEAQENIRTILEFLNERYPGMAVAVEGAAGPLHPEYFDLMPDYPGVGNAVVRDLKEKGEVNGAELFAWEKYQEGGGRRADGASRFSPSTIHHLPSIVGVEDAALYRANLKAYQEVLSASGTIETLLNPLRTELEKRGSRVFSADLREFMKERTRRKEGRYSLTQSAQDPDLEAYLAYLEKTVLKTLAIDLSDPFEQLRFPNLVRLKKIRLAHNKGLDPVKTAAEWQDLFKELGKKLPGEKGLLLALRYFAASNGLLGDERPAGGFPFEFNRALFPRKLLEYLFYLDGRHRLGLVKRTQVLESFRPAILRSELNAAGLFEEMGTLEDLLIEKLAVKEEEKKLVAELRTFSLLEKALRLELTRRDYASVLSGSKAFDGFIRDSKPLKAFFEKALEFYRLAGERDRALINNALTLLRPDDGRRMADGANRLSLSSVLHPPSDVVILVTGGFHTDGIAEILSQQGIRHAVITPRITRTDRGELYQKTMTGENADLSAYFKTKNPFRTKQEAVFFKEMIENAAPVLFENYKMDPAGIAAQVEQAVKASPVLFQAVETQVSGQDAAALRFTPKLSGEALPQNAAIPAALLSNGNDIFVSLQGLFRITGTVPAEVRFSREATLRIRIRPALEEKETAVVDGLNVAFGTIPGFQAGSRLTPPSRTQSPEPAEGPSGGTGGTRQMAGGRSEMRTEKSNTAGESVFPGYQGTPVGRVETGLSPQIYEAHSAGDFEPMELVRKGPNEEQADFMKRTEEERAQKAEEQFNAGVAEIMATLKRVTELMKTEEEADERAGRDLAYAREKLATIQKRLDRLPENMPEYAREREDLLAEQERFRKSAQNAEKRAKNPGEAFKLYVIAETFIEASILGTEWLRFTAKGRLERSQAKIRAAEDSKVRLEELKTQITQLAAAIKEGKGDPAEMVKLEEERKGLEEKIEGGEQAHRAMLAEEEKREKVKREILKQMIDENVSFSTIFHKKFVAEAHKTLRKFQREMMIKTIMDRIVEIVSRILSALFRRKTILGTGEGSKQPGGKRGEKLFKAMKERIGSATSIAAAIRQRETAIQDIDQLRREEPAADGEMALFVRDSISPEDYRHKIHPRFGSNLKVIVAKSGESLFDEDAAVLNHLKIAIGADANPPILIMLNGDDFERAYQMIKEGKIKNVTVSTNEKDGRAGGKVILNPSEATQKAYGDESKKRKFWGRVLRRYLRGIRFDFTGAFHVNSVPGELPTLHEVARNLGSAKLGVGLHRTEMMTVEMEQAVLSLIDNLGEALKDDPGEKDFWFTPEKSAEETKPERAEVRQAAMDQAPQLKGYAAMRQRALSEILAWLEDPSVQRLLKFMETGVRTELGDPMLAGEILRKRTFDFRSDKNAEIFKPLIEKSIVTDTQAESGFNLYRKKFGRLMLILQITAYLNAQAAVTAQERAQLEVILPMVQGTDDVDYFQNVILPVAQEVVIHRMRSQTDNPSESTDAKIHERLRQVTDEIHFGTMLETRRAVRDELDALLRHPLLTVFNLGMNDAQMEELVRTLTLGRLEHALDEIESALIELERGEDVMLDRTFDIWHEKISQARQTLDDQMADPSGKVTAILEEISGSAQKEGLTDVQAMIKEKLAPLRKMAQGIFLERQDPWIAALVGKLDPKFLWLIDHVASRFQAYNEGRPEAEWKSLCLCGEAAQDPSFGPFLKHLQFKYPAVPMSRSMAPASLAENVFLWHRLEHLRQDQLAELFGVYSHRTEAASRALAAASFDLAKAVMIATEEWHERFQASGFYYTFYRKDIDPVRGIGSAAEFDFIKKMALLLSRVQSPRHIRLNLPPLSPEDTMLPEEVAGVLGAMEGILLLLPNEREEAERAFEFLRNVRTLFEAKRKEEPAKYREHLYVGNLNDFLAEFQRRYRPSWLSDLSDRPTEAEFQNRQQQFWEQYYRHANHVFNASIRIAHMTLAEVFPPEYSEVLTLRTIETGKGQIELQSVQRLGWMFEREEGFVVKKVRELSVFALAGLEKVSKSSPGILKLPMKEAIAQYPSSSPEDLGAILEEYPQFSGMPVEEALKNEALSMIILERRLEENPDLALQIFRATGRSEARSSLRAGMTAPVRAEAGEQIRISYRLQRALIKASQGMPPLSQIPKEQREASNQGILSLFSDEADISYAVWRLHRWRYFDKFWTGWEGMRNVFALGEQRFAVHMQTLRAFEFMEKLADAKSEVLSLASFVFQRIRSLKDRERIMALRLAILADGIIRVTHKDTIDKGAPSQDEVAQSVQDILKNFGVSKKLEEQVTWLCYNQQLLSMHELITTDEMVNAMILVLKHLRDGKGGWLPDAQNRLGMLFVMTLSNRIGLTDPDKIILRIREGADSPLAIWSAFYLATSALVEDVQRFGFGDAAQKEQGGYLSEQDIRDTARRARQRVMFGGVKKNEGETIDLKQIIPELFQPQTVEKILSDYLRHTVIGRDPDAIRERLNDLFRGEDSIQQAFNLYMKTVSPFLVKTLLHDPETLIRQIIFFNHVRLSNEANDHETTPVAFSPLPEHGYNMPYEILIGISENEPDMASLLHVWSTVLYKNGFFIENAAVYSLENGKGNAVRFLGSFANESGDLPKVKEAVRRDLEEIFKPVSFVSTRFRMPWRTRARQRVLDRFRNMDGSEKYKAIQVTIRPGTPMQLTDPKFIKDADEPDLDVLSIVTPDRPGLCSLKSGIFSRVFKDLKIRKVRFDDLKGGLPRTLVYLTDKKGRRLTPEMQKKVAETFKFWLGKEAVVMEKGKLRELARSEARGAVALRDLPYLAGAQAGIAGVVGVSSSNAGRRSEVRQDGWKLSEGYGREESFKPEFTEGLIASLKNTIAKARLGGRTIDRVALRVGDASDVTLVPWQMLIQENMGKGAVPAKLSSRENLEENLRRLLSLKGVQIVQYVIRPYCTVRRPKKVFGILPGSETQEAPLLTLTVRSAAGRPEGGRSSVRSEVREVTNRQRIAFLMGHVVNNQTMLLLPEAVRRKEAVTMTMIRSCITELIRLFRIFDVADMKRRGEGLFILKRNPNILAHVKMKGFLGEEAGKILQGEKFDRLAKETGFEDLRKEFETETAELRSWRSTLEKENAAELTLDQRYAIGALAERIVSKSNKTMARLKQETTVIKKILVVEKEPSVRAFLEHFLRLEGYTVIPLADEGDALEHLNGHRDLDCLIMENGPAGKQLLEAMADGKLPRKIPVILTATTQDTPDLMPYWTRNVFVELLHKPNLVGPISKILGTFGAPPQGRSETRTEKASAPDVKRPLDMPPEEAAKVRKIFIVGHQGKENAQLSYDVKHFAVLVPLLLTKFPNARIDMAVDYANQFSAKKFQGRIAIAKDPAYTVLAEPQDPVETVHVPRGAILATVDEGKPGALLSWLSDNGYDFVFDFTKSGPKFEEALFSLADRSAAPDAAGSKRLPVVFINMSPLPDTNVTPSKAPEPVFMIDVNKPKGDELHRVSGTENLVRPTPKHHQPPKYWEMIFRIYRELGLLKERFDLQLVDLQLVDLGNWGLDELEKEWVKPILEDMFHKSGFSPEETQGIMNGDRKFVYVNIFSHTNPELSAREVWSKILSGVLEQTNAILFFSSGSSKDEAASDQLKVLMDELITVHPGARKQIVRVFEGLPVSKVTQLMRVMDLVITPDHSGFSDIATVLNVPQAEVVLKKDSPTATYRVFPSNEKNSILVEKDSPSPIGRIKDMEAMKKSGTVRSRVLQTEGFQKVLVVDDDPSLRNLEKLILTSMKIPEVVMAENGAQALEMYRNDPGIDFVLTDNNMSVMDGIDFMKEALKIRPCPFVVVSGAFDGTGYAKIDTIKFQHPESPIFTMAKPFFPKDLMASVNQMLDLKKNAGAQSRAELRGTEQFGLKGTTAEVKAALMKVEARGGFKLVENWIRSELREPIAAAAETAGTYSEASVAFHITDGAEDAKLRKARLWVAARLIEALTAKANEQGISEPALKQMIAGIMNAVPGSVKSPSSAVEQGPAVHVDLSFLGAEDWQGLIKSFPVVLANLVSLNGKLMINVNSAAVKPEQLRSEVLQSAEAQGIKLAPDQIAFVSVQDGRTFVSLEKVQEADALMAGSESAFEKVRFSQRIGSRWVADGNAVKDMPLLAAEISTVLYAALDQRVDRFKIHQPSEYGSGALLQAVLTAVQAYLQIRAAA